MYAYANAGSAASGQAESIASVFAGPAASPSQPAAPPQVVFPEEFDAVTQAALEQTMQKYGDDMIRLLEVMAGRLETLERTTDRLQRTFVSIKEENQKHDKCKVGSLKSLEADCKNCLQDIQVLREQHENVVIEEQKRALLEKKAEVSAARAKAESREAESAPMAPVQESAPIIQHQPTAGFPAALSHPPISNYLPGPLDPYPQDGAFPPVPPEHFQPQETPYNYQPPTTEPTYLSQAPHPGIYPPLQMQPVFQPPRDYLPPPTDYQTLPPPPPPMRDFAPPPPRVPPPPFDDRHNTPPPVLQTSDRRHSPPRSSVRESRDSRSPPPAARSSGGSSGGASGGPQLSTSKVPIDKVIKDVSAMGFTEDEVRTIVKKLTEKGQSVDLNVVLDKLMNGEGAAAPATQKKKGWFGRG